MESEVLNWLEIPVKELQMKLNPHTNIKKKHESTANEHELRAQGQYEM